MVKCIDIDLNITHVHTRINTHFIYCMFNVKIHKKSNKIYALQYSTEILIIKVSL